MVYAFILLGSVVFLDMILSGDNAVVIAMAANGLSPANRNRAILFGMIGAAIARILFALLATSLLHSHLIGFLGGLILLWVAYKLGKDLLTEKAAGETPLEGPQSFFYAIGLILMADISMSLDNVLAVAALARNHPWIMGLGILVSIFFLAYTAKYIADLMLKWKWISWLGLVLILWVAFDLILSNYDFTLTFLRA